MSNHTEGPWKSKQTRGNNRFDYTLYRVVGDFPGALATIEFVNCDTAKANARLMAAAPELLAALQEAGSYIKKDILLSEKRTSAQTALLM